MSELPDASQEFEALLSSEAPELKVVPQGQFRSGPELISWMYQALLFGSSIGAFGGLWKVCELFVKRHANCTVKLSYPAEDGSTVQVEYSNLTVAEAHAITTQRPPRLESRILVTVGSNRLLKN